MNIWIVTYWDRNTEPTVTAFTSEKEAQKAVNYFGTYHRYVIVDKTQVYETFKVSETC